MSGVCRGARLKTEALLNVPHRLKALFWALAYLAVIGAVTARILAGYPAFGESPAMRLAIAVPLWLGGIACATIWFLARYPRRKD
ncbi:hypothetical protein [Defluviimonas salinarum]|uniref:Uncharacterized protein n=1 Tax=Defluviimonas salinarum TaxID=2992147 RepID=A0ABT3J7C1_9RHOB|nr:hypothetical protein [Defluviimonas salinarum]MCW3783591.1 hypothetical protein [Defluviimonas salinarum]